MKSKKSLFIVPALLVSLTAPSVSRAYCLGDPVSCTLVPIGIVVGIIHGLKKPKLQSISLTGSANTAEDERKLQEVVSDLNSANPNFTIIMGEYSKYSPGYESIIELVQANRTADLQKLQAYAPKLFEHLDAFESLMKKHFGGEATLKAYGPKITVTGQTAWQRYAVLAADARALYHDLFYFP